MWFERRGMGFPRLLFSLLVKRERNPPLACDKGAALRRRLPPGRAGPVNGARGRESEYLPSIKDCIRLSAYRSIAVAVFSKRRLSMKAAQLKAFNALPPSSTCRLIPFSKAIVVPGFLPKTFFLIVSGTKPWVTMTVELRP
jgi:hypothetical protein